MSTSCVERDVSPTPSTARVQKSIGQQDECTCVSNYFRWKGILDRGIAVMLLLPGLPLMGILIALLRLTSKGPGVYRQARVGRGGVHYVMFKLRSMRIDAEYATGAVWARQGDSRVTPLGYWLRKLHLDELPQLFNVLRGEMSLIGPRPERPEFVRLLSDEIPGYADRLHVLPGVTGLAQINLPADSDLNDVRRKIVLDREYIETGSFLLDLRILCCTLLRMLGLRGGKAMRLMRLERTVQIELGNPHFAVTPTAPTASDEKAMTATTSVTNTDTADDEEPATVGVAQAS
ncbi:MAG TPA: sugar transferase [Pirellulaceae bacterium]|nr:sugar transferase [Pirellulaceae bacterium]